MSHAITVPDNAIFFQITIKLRDGFTDPNGFFEDLKNSDLTQEAPFGWVIAHEDNNLIISGVSEAPESEMANAANELFKDQDAD